MDCLALMIAKSPQKGKTDAIVIKELGVQGESSKSAQNQQQFGSGATTKDSQIYALI